MNSILDINVSEWLILRIILRNINQKLKFQHTIIAIKKLLYFENCFASIVGLISRKNEITLNEVKVTTLNNI